MALVLSDPLPLFESGAVVGDDVGVDMPPGDESGFESTVDVPREDEAVDDEDDVGLVEGDEVVATALTAQSSGG